MKDSDPEDAPELESHDSFERHLEYVGPLFFILWGIFAVVMLSLGKGTAADYLVARIDEKLAFNLKESWRPSGSQPEDLTILVIDDQTVAFNQNRPELDLAVWDELLANIARQKPRVILIDRIFAGNPFPAHASEADKQAIQTRLDHIKSLAVPIIVGADIVAREIPRRLALELAAPAHHLASYTTEPDPIKALPQFRLSQDIAYGHAPEYRGVFAGVGHVRYDNQGIATVSPLRLITQNKLVPHISLYASLETKIKDEALWVNGHRVPLNALGQVALMHKPPQFFKPKSLTGPIKRALAGEPEHLVHEGDVVFIIPQFYTGATDFHEGGPFGEIPGGYIIAEMLTSILTGDWLHIMTRSDGYHAWLLVSLLVLGAALGYRARPMHFWFYAGLVTALYGSISLGLFFYSGRLWPLALPLLSFWGAALLLYAHTILQAELQRMKLRRDFFREKALRIQEESERKLLEERLALGKAVQEMLLPQNLAGQMADFSYQMRYSPSQQMSGDWLYYWEVSQDERRIFIGDVVGKGPSAALPVAIIITTIKEAETQNMTMEQTIGFINRRLLDHFNGNVTTTLAAVAMFADQRIRFYNAGSPGWFVIDGVTANNYLNLRSNPLGITRDNKPASTELKISQTTLFFTFTDGYMEGARAYRRLIRAISAHEFHAVTHDLVHHSLIETGAGYRLEDDMTMVSIKVA